MSEAAISSTSASCRRAASRPPSSATIPRPPSVHALPPSPTTIRVAPTRSASAMSCPTPLLWAASAVSGVGGPPSNARPHACAHSKYAVAEAGIEHPLGVYRGVQRPGHPQPPLLPQPAGQHLDETRAAVGLRGDDEPITRTRPGPAGRDGGGCLDGREAVAVAIRGHQNQHGRQLETTGREASGSIIRGHRAVVHHRQPFINVSVGPSDRRTSGSMAHAYGTHSGAISARLDPRSNLATVKLLGRKKTHEEDLEEAQRRRRTTLPVPRTTASRAHAQDRPQGPAHTQAHRCGPAQHEEGPGRTGTHDRRPRRGPGASRWPAPSSAARSAGPKGLPAGPG